MDVINGRKEFGETAGSRIDCVCGHRHAKRVKKRGHEKPQGQHQKVDNNNNPEKNGSGVNTFAPLLLQLFFGPSVLASNSNSNPNNGPFLKMSVVGSCAPKVFDDGNLLHLLGQRALVVNQRPSVVLDGAAAAARLLRHVGVATGRRQYQMLGRLVDIVYCLPKSIEKMTSILIRFLAWTLILFYLAAVEEIAGNEGSPGRLCVRLGRRCRHVRQTGYVMSPGRGHQVGRR